MAVSRISLFKDIFDNAGVKLVSTPAILKVNTAGESADVPYIPIL